MNKKMRFGASFLKTQGAILDKETHETPLYVFFRFGLISKSPCIFSGGSSKLLFCIHRALIYSCAQGPIKKIRGLNTIIETTTNLKGA